MEDPLPVFGLFGIERRFSLLSTFTLEEFLE